MKNLEKAKLLVGVFSGGVRTQLAQEWTWGAAASIGIYQGLKYKGDIKSGILTGAVVLGALACANGGYNIVANWGQIQKVMRV